LLFVICYLFCDSHTLYYYLHICIFVIRVVCNQCGTRVVDYAARTDQTSALDVKLELWHLIKSSHYSYHDGTDSSLVSN